MGDRATLQATQTEFPIEILLWGKRKCHQDTDMGHTHRQSADYGYPEKDQTQVEFLRVGHHVQDYAHVLRELLHFLGGTGKRLDEDSEMWKGGTARGQSI